MTRSRIDPFTPEWTVFRKGDAIAVVPGAPLLIRLRRVIGEEYFGQAPLAPLKKFMDGIFIAGPLCIIAALYLPTGGGFLVWFGILCLAVASLYWFAPHFLCRLYLTRRGYAVTDVVEAPDYESALAKGNA